MTVHVPDLAPAPSRAAPPSQPDVAAGLSRPRLALAVLAALAFAAAAILARVWHTAHDPLWLDEAYSAYAAGKGFGFLWHVVPTYETHPPLYYSMVRVWTLLFGDGLVALRWLGYVAGFATIALLWPTARAIGARLGAGSGRGIAFAALVLAALSPPLVEMSRELRPYPVLILAYTAAILGVFRATARPGRLAPRWFTLYCGAYALVLWLHNLGPLYGAALGLAALALFARPGVPLRQWALFVGGHALAVLIWLPALAILRDQAPTWISSTWLTFSPHLLHWQLALLWGAPSTAPSIATAVLLLLGLWRLAEAPEGWRPMLALLLAMALPVALSIALSLAVTPVFIPRTLTGTTIPALLVIAVALGGASGVRRIAALLCCAMLLTQMAAMDLAARQGPPPQNWYPAVRWLAHRYRPGDVVLAYPNEGALPFDFAVRDLGVRIPSQPVPGPVPTTNYPGGWYPTGSRGVVSLPQPQLQAIASRPRIARAPTVWLLRLGARTYDKQDMFLTALARGRHRVARYRAGPIDLIGLRRVELR